MSHELALLNKMSLADLEVVIGCGVGWEPPWASKAWDKVAGFGEMDDEEDDEDDDEDVLEHELAMLKFLLTNLGW